MARYTFIYIEHRSGFIRSAWLCSTDMRYKGGDTVDKVDSHTDCWTLGQFRLFQVRPSLHLGM